MSYAGADNVLHLVLEGGRLYLEYMEKPCVDLIFSVLSPVLVMYRVIFFNWASPENVSRLAPPNLLGLPPLNL